MALLELDKLRRDINILFGYIKCLMAKENESSPLVATAWSPNHTIALGNPYFIGNYVYWEGHIYACIANNESMPPTNSTFWKDLGEGHLLQEEIGGSSGEETDPIFQTWLATNPLDSYFLTPLGTTSDYLNGEGNPTPFPTIPTVATDLDALKRNGSNANSDVNVGDFGLISKFLKVIGNAYPGGVFFADADSKAVTMGDVDGSVNNTKLVVSDGDQTIEFSISNLDNFRVNGQKILTQLEYDLLSSTVDTELFTKVDKVSGYGLSQQNFSSVDKSKLDSLSNYAGFRGAQSSLASIITAYPTGTIGDWAIITNATGNAYFAIWDSDNSTPQWVEAGQSPTIPGTNLDYTITGNALTITSDTGNDVVIPLATSTTAGLQSKEDKSKLNAISGTNTGDETTSTIKTKLGITTLSGNNTGDETASRIAIINHGTSAKTTLVDADEITGQDSASSFSLIRMTCLNLYSYLKTKFDSVYTTTSAVATQITTALSGYATTSYVNSQGFLTAITSGNINSALGFVPYKFVQTSQTAILGSVVGTTETIVATATISGNTFLSNDVIKAIFKTTKGSTVAAPTMRLRINTTNSLSGSVQIGTFTPTIVYTFSKMVRGFDLQGGNLYGYGFTSGVISDDTANNTAGSSTAYNTANTLFFFFTVQLGNAADSITPNLCNLTN